MLIASIPPPLQWNEFSAKINSAKPNKAGGRDECNVRLFSLAPDHVLEILFHACHYLLLTEESRPGALLCTVERHGAVFPCPEVVQTTFSPY